MTPRRIVPVLGALLVVADLVEVGTTHDWSGPLLAVLVAAVLIPAPLAFAAVRPLAAGLGTLVALLVTAVVLGTPQSLVPLLSLLLAEFVIGFGGGRFRWAVGAGGLLTAAVAIARAQRGGLPPSVVAFVFAVLLYSAPVVLGAVVRARTDAAGAARAAADRAEREQRLTALLAVRDERDRIARDLREVVTAAVGGIIAGAEAGRVAVRTDPAAASAAFDAVEATGRHALEDMRRLLGLLRSIPSPAPRAPQPRLADLEPLLSAAASQGAQPSIRIVGAPRPLSESVELCAYRLIESALEEAAERPGAVEVGLEYGEEELLVMVRTDGDVIGSVRMERMRERALLCGGSLAIQRGDAHVSVTAALPVPA